MELRSVKSLTPAQLAGKVVLVRADLNVPMRDGAVSGFDRIDRFVPTLDFLLSARARVVVVSHLGQPRGAAEARFSQRVVAQQLAVRAGVAVDFVPYVTGTEVLQAVARCGDGEAIMLENLRFHAGEAANDMQFATDLARGCELYVNDAFSCSHRAHASLLAITRVLPAYAGLSLCQEIAMLEATLTHPARPVLALVGGAKVSSKADVLRNLVTRVDELVVGGGMANTFLLARGVDMGRSMVEVDALETARSVMAEARRAGCRILYPCDVMVARELSNRASARCVSVGGIGSEEMALDLGSDSVAAIEASINNARTVLWNGPLGAFETEQFAAATVAVARAVASGTAAGGLLSVAGGGETVAALRKAGVADKFSYVSAAGGAFLRWLEGKAMPAISALEV